MGIMREVDRLVMVYGPGPNLRKAKEELAELIVAISHYEECRDDCVESLIEEICDVRIVLQVIEKCMESSGIPREKIRAFSQVVYDEKERKMKRY